MIDGLLNRYRTLVRRVPDERARRRPGDAVRIVVAVLVLALLALHANDPTAPERAFARFLRSLPHDADSFILVFYDLLALWALGLLAFALLLVRRWRLARDVVAAGALAWVLGRLVAVFVDRVDLGRAFRVTFDLSAIPSFPLVRVAMAVAVVTVASPYLARPTRRVGQSIVLLLALASMYLGRSLPADVVAAIVLGWGVAAAVHLAFGTAARRPTVEQTTRAMTAFGVPCTNVREADDQPVARAVFLADGGSGPLRIVAIGRDEADAQLMARISRWIAYRDAPPTFLPTRRQQVESEAYTILLARESAVRAPKVVAAGARGPLALLVTTDVRGHPLDACSLDDAWVQTTRLHGAGVAHGRLDTAHLVADDDDRVTIVGWERAVAGASARQRSADVAQLLAATAAIVGPDAAVTAAVAGAGRDQVAAALPLLQSGALSRVTKDAVADGESTTLLADVRERAAAATGVEPPELQELYRVNPRRLLMAVGALIAIAVLLSRVGDPVEFWESIRDASWGFVALAFAFGILTDVAFAVAFLGTVPVRIPLWPSIELQSSMSFSNLAVPIAADTAVQIRFLQKFGLDLPSAVATGGIFSTVSELFVQAGLFFLALWLSPDSINFGRIDTNQIVVVVLIVIFLIGVGAAVVFSVRRIRRAVIPRVVRRRAPYGTR